MELPSHPQSDDTGREQHGGSTVNWGAVIVIAVLAAVVAAVVILHLFGVVGPAAH